MFNCLLKLNYGVPLTKVQTFNFFSHFQIFCRNNKRIASIGAVERHIYKPTFIITCEHLSQELSLWVFLVCLLLSWTFFFFMTLFTFYLVDVSRKISWKKTKYMWYISFRFFFFLCDFGFQAGRGSKWNRAILGLYGRLQAEWITRSADSFLIHFYYRCILKQIWTY